MFLAAVCLSLALCPRAFSGDPQSGCRKGHFREWLRAVFTVQCKTCKDPPAPEPAAKDAPTTDAAPATPAPAGQPATP